MNAADIMSTVLGFNVGLRESNPFALVVGGAYGNTGILIALVLFKMIGLAAVGIFYLVTVKIFPQVHDACLYATAVLLLLVIADYSLVTFGNISVYLRFEGFTNWSWTA